MAEEEGELQAERVHLWQQADDALKGLLSRRGRWRLTCFLAAWYDIVAKHHVEIRFGIRVEHVGSRRPPRCDWEVAREF